MNEYKVKTIDVNSNVVTMTIWTTTKIKAEKIAKSLPSDYGFLVILARVIES